MDNDIKIYQECLKNQLPNNVEYSIKLIEKYTLPLNFINVNGCKQPASVTEDQFNRDHNKIITNKLAALNWKAEGFYCFCNNQEDSWIDQSICFMNIMPKKANKTDPLIGRK